MTSVALIGARGFVGSALAEALERGGRVRLVRVTREEYGAARAAAYDVVINAAMPSGRFRARQDPQRDFDETVSRTAGLLYEWRFAKLIQVSSISARAQRDTVYGRHKAAAEALCDPARDLVVRLLPMYDATLRKGVLIDILHGRTVYADGESRYAFAPLVFVADWIASHLDRTGLVEVGARNAVALRDVADHLRASVKFEGPIDHQEIEHPDAAFPDARDVLAFLDQDGAALRSACLTR